MENFYKEHEGYKELSMQLKEYNLEKELVSVVGAAIQYGISALSKELAYKGGINARI